MSKEVLLKIKTISGVAYCKTKDVGHLFIDEKDSVVSYFISMSNNKRHEVPKQSFYKVLKELEGNNE